MKIILAGVCAMALSFAGGAVAQDKSTAAQKSKETTQSTKTVTGDKTIKNNMEVVTGQVDSYEAGKSLSVTVPGTIIKTKSFDLNDKNETVHMPANVKKGDWVTVKENTDNNGHKTLTVAHSKPKPKS